MAAHHAGWDPQPGLALVRLAQGDVDIAAASIREALDRPSLVPSKELPPSTDLRRAPLLEAQVEIAIAAGDIDRARSAADELEVVANRFQSKALVACAVATRAKTHLAEGDATEAERLFSEAARAWNAVGAPYEAAVARLGLADAYRALGSEHRADLEVQAARTTLDRIGREPSIDSAVPTARHSGPEHERAQARSAFRREGDYWSLVFEGRTVRVRDLKGMRYLGRLLADPAREFHVLDLVAAETTRHMPNEREAASGRVALGDAGLMLDAQAKDAYRRRLAEIDEDIEHAHATGDELREQQADIERDFLVRELSRAVGLGGRGRRAGAASERGRAAVTRAVRQAMTRIGEHHPELAEHLNRTIRTGRYCSYAPDPRIPADWNL